MEIENGYKERIKQRVSSGTPGRLDQFLHSCLDGFSRSYVKKQLKEG